MKASEIALHFFKKKRQDRKDISKQADLVPIHRGKETVERKMEDRHSNALTEVEKGGSVPRKKEMHFRQNEGYLFIYSCNYLLCKIHVHLYWGYAHPHKAV